MSNITQNQAGIPELSPRALANAERQFISFATVRGLSLEKAGDEYVAMETRYLWEGFLGARLRSAALLGLVATTLEGAGETIEHHLGSSLCGCWDKEDERTAVVLIKRLCEGLNDFV